jgi:prolipoprotein diacylglyceryl transferase
MQSSDHIVWNADPSIFNTGTFSSPFPISIVGFVAAIAIMYYGFSKMMPKEGVKPNVPKPETWKTWGLVIGALVGCQLLFVALDITVINEIGPIQPRWYGFLFAGAFAFGYYMMFKMYKHADYTQEDLDVLLFYVLFATVIGARLGHVIFYDLGYYARNLDQVLAIWRGGLASHGAAIGILLAMYFYAKKYADMSFLWIADRVVVVVASGGAFIRTGNFINSEIVGKPTDLPWGIIFTNARVADPMVPRHPTMLYEALLCVAIFALLWVIYKRYKNNPPEGAIFGTFLVLLFGGRFLLEFTKINQAAFAAEWTINMGQWLSIPLIAAGIWLLASKVNWKRQDPAAS